jgi:photosystem II stability/assembly factor-like uncharacterized protein
VASRSKKRRAPNKRPVQAPKQQAQAPGWRQPWFVWAAIAAVAVGAVVAAVVVRSGTDKKEPAAAAPGLPNTPDYHSLSVSPTDANSILLGTHSGLYRSGDGGRTWALQALSGQDAMNLARPSGNTLWTAGHNVLAKSTDGGRRWVDVRPDGLPTLDLHGFAVDPRNVRTLYAAVAGQGLYRSTDNGVSFSRVSKEVGGAVMALAVTPSGGILAGDMEQGLLASKDGGRTWRRVLATRLMGIALNPTDPKRLLAAGPGVLLSTDGGRRWRQPLKIAEGAGPVAWSPGSPNVAYVVGYDRILYRSSDGGEAWRAVG